MFVGVGGSRRPLHDAAPGQDFVQEAPIVFVITAIIERIEAKYGRQRSPRYVQLEVGYAAQNLLLQAVALRLGAVPVRALDDRAVQQALGLPQDHRPLYLIPVGYPE